VRVESENVLTGRYRLDERLGRGASGEVWRGHDLKLSRPVAIKVLRDADPDKTMRKRFHREAAMAAGLQHACITVVYDYDEHDGQLFIVTELLRGEDLGKVMAAFPDGLAVSRALDFGVQLADALIAAHAKGIVHRDLKPANIFIQVGDRLKVCDFGLARDLNSASSLSMAGDVIGTPAYMAPEQWVGPAASPSVDLYALGCILHEMVTGEPPFTGPGLPVVMHQHLTESPVPSHDLNPEVPEPLNDLVVSLLAKDAADRPQKAADVRAALAQISTDLYKETLFGQLSSPVPAPPRVAPPVAGSASEAESAEAAESLIETKPVSEPAPLSALLPVPAAEPAMALPPAPRAAPSGPIVGLMTQEQPERPSHPSQPPHPSAAPVVPLLACGSPVPGLLEVFALNEAGGIRTRAYRDASTGGANWAWSDWANASSPPGPVTALAASGAYVMGVLDGNQWIRAQGNWAPMHPLPAFRPAVANVAISAGPAGSAGSGNPELFILDVAGGIWHEGFAHSFGPAIPGPGERKATAIAACSNGNDLALISVASGVFCKSRVRGTSWSGWREVGGRRFPVEVVTCSSLRHKFEVFALSRGGRIWLSASRPQLVGGAPVWSEWTRVPNPPGRVATITASAIIGRVGVLAAITTDGVSHYVHYERVPGDQFDEFEWSDWSLMPLT
jgi:serine/threonine protein kinase